jgi:flagellar biosynthesis chaperone FliJ
MPLLFLLPTIFMGAFLETARTANEDIVRALANGTKLKQQINAEEQIDVLNHTVSLLRDQLADMHKQQDRWQSRAGQVSLTASY